jgi:hypothetical protein
MNLPDLIVIAELAIAACIAFSDLQRVDGCIIIDEQPDLVE